MKFKMRVVPKKGSPKIVTVEHYRLDGRTVIKKAILASGFNIADIKECSHIRE